MRYQLFLLLATTAILISSCSKSGGDELDDDDTRVKFINTLPRSLDNVKVGTWIGDGKPAKLLRSVGTLAAGANTGDIKIADPSIIKVYFYYDEPNGKTYMSDYGFGIAQYTFNNWNIDNNVHFMEISKTSELYPR